MRYGYAEGERPLTPRMRDVLRCAAQGANARETALELGIAEPTVWAIRTAALARLGASNITAAVHTAFKRGEL